MHYLVTPAGIVGWAKLPPGIVDALGSGQASLDGVPWDTDTRLTFDDAKLRLALRHGTAVPDGILVPGFAMVAPTEADSVRAHAIASAERNAQYRAETDELMEKIMPGHTEYRDKIDRGVPASFEYAAQQREADHAELLAEDPIPELVEHWKNIGGAVPSPL